jgi:hypothetical protein
VSSGGVRGVWSATKHERLLRLEETASKRKLTLTDEQIEALERLSPEFRERHIDPRSYILHRPVWRPHGALDAPPRLGPHGTRKPSPATTCWTGLPNRNGRIDLRCHPRVPRGSPAHPQSPRGSRRWPAGVAALPLGSTRLCVLSFAQSAPILTEGGKRRPTTTYVAAGCTSDRRPD